MARLSGGADAGEAGSNGGNVVPREGEEAGLGHALGRVEYREEDAESIGEGSRGRRCGGEGVVAGEGRAKDDRLEGTLVG